MIVKDPNLLRQKSEAVDKDEGLEISSSLLSYLEDNDGGIGLAAPQVGIQKRVFVIRRTDERFLFLINPNILELEGPFINKNEGCLSFPGVRIDTVRYSKVVWTDELRKEPLTLLGRDALVFQHEYDHIDGVLMFDRKVPKKYDLCFCGSENKYKFCCMKLLDESK